MKFYLEVEYQLDNDEMSFLEKEGLKTKEEIINFANTRMNISDLDKKLINGKIVDMDL